MHDATQNPNVFARAMWTRDHDRARLVGDTPHRSVKLPSRRRARTAGSASSDTHPGASYAPARSHIVTTHHRFHIATYVPTPGRPNLPVYPNYQSQCAGTGYRDTPTHIDLYTLSTHAARKIHPGSNRGNAAAKGGNTVSPARSSRSQIDTTTHPFSTPPDLFAFVGPNGAGGGLIVLSPRSPKPFFTKGGSEKERGRGRGRARWNMSARIERRVLRLGHEDREERFETGALARAGARGAALEIHLEPMATCQQVRPETLHLLNGGPGRHTKHTQFVPTLEGRRKS